MPWNLTGTSGEARGRRPYAGSGAAPAQPSGTSGALSVSEALSRAKGALEGMVLVVEGEVSQFRDSPAYKAVYFPLADPGGVMDCMMWRNRYAAAGVELRPGLRVRLTGRFSVYPAKGRMQFEVFKLEPAGEGDLRERVARLARKLQAEGLMDPARKPPVPAFCQRVAVVTSPHGKVKDDVARTLRRRNPMVELLYCAVPVEGAAAAAQMAQALRVAEAARPDVILLVRGGGSYEDLMPFNDEGLARAVAACRVPVVTGIGHEPDTTICDMVAARRASTPTAAAESVAPAASELLAGLDATWRRAGEALRRDLAARGRVLDVLAARPALADPLRTLVEQRRERLDFAHDRLVGALPDMVEARRSETARAALRLAAAARRLCPLRAAGLDGAAKRLHALGACGLLAGPARGLAVAAGRLEALSPLAVIARGYAMALDGEGRVVSSVARAASGDALTVRVSDGELDCRVEGVRAEPAAQRR